MTVEADAIIGTLGMQQHPEGGWYVETFRDVAGPDGRARSTVIYFLLKAGESSHWHRVDAVETWFFHAGAPLELRLSDDGKTKRTVVLGPDVLAGQRPQGLVPKDAWQAARTTGEYTLVSCTVAPGFEFKGFELAPPGWEPHP
ncbi:MAG: cupin domain-containing protein [Archangium sp.]|nr:cupin domain-containing protein [Archangium sp.]